MFKVTPAAAAQVTQAAKQSGAEGLALRLAATRKDDGSFDYRMGFDSAAEDDIQFRCEGIDIAIAPESIPLLDKTTLDFVELDEGDFQFIFVNPLDPHYTPPKHD